MKVYDVSSVVPPTDTLPIVQPAAGADQSWDCRPASGTRGAVAFTESVGIGAGSTSVGASKRGTRSVIPITGGTASGRVSGSVLSGGADYQLRASSFSLDARYTIRTSDGFFILIRNCGPIGDSYMNWVSHTFPQDLDAAAGVTFRPTYSIGAYAMGSGGIGLIPTQFDTALSQDKDIIAVVMDGGGNDVLVPAPGRPDCKNMANAGMVAGCQQIVTDAMAAAETLMNKMVAAGVRDVIYFFYPHVPAPTLIGGNYPNVMLDYALPKVKAFCDGVTAKTQGKGNCWFVDTVPLFEGHPEYFAETDIHENSAGSKVIAKAVVDMMKSKCIAQPVSSGCCTP